MTVMTPGLVALPPSPGLPPGFRPDVERAVTRPAAQQPPWPVDDLRRVVAELAGRPPLVDADAVETLHEQLGRVATGDALVLQGGDCAESFADGTDHVERTLGVLDAAARTLEEATGLPVVRIGRLAGQYAKPRSRPEDALGLPVYRGDAVNDPRLDLASRRADPDRLLTAWDRSRRTLDVLDDAARRGSRTWASHEMLLVDYEAAALRARQGRLYLSSAHLPWIGERTRQVDGAHVALLGLVQNPVGIKIGPGTTPDELRHYLDVLGADRRPGHVTLITRMGAAAVRTVLPPLVHAVEATGAPVVWQCDPMHGNTRESSDGYKTRHLTDVLDEVGGYLDVHRRAGTHPGGVHLEMTGDPVTECLDGPVGADDIGLAARYESTCDPRLDASQTALVARLVASALSVR